MDMARRSLLAEKQTVSHFTLHTRALAALNPEGTKPIQNYRKAIEGMKPHHPGAQIQSSFFGSGFDLGFGKSAWLMEPRGLNERPTNCLWQSGLRDRGLKRRRWCKGRKIWGFPKKRGTLSWGPYNKDPTIQGTELGPPIFGNPHIVIP